MKLNLKNPIVFFDLETTGTNINTDRIVEICYLKVYPNGNEEAKIVSISNYTLYKYKTDDKTCILNSKGKKIECTKDDIKLSYSDDLVYYLSDNKIVMINAQNSKKNKYNLENNEKINDISIDATPIYNLINNTEYKMIQYKILVEEVSKDDTTWIKEKLS